MRILWVKIGGLWPLNSGGRLRSFHTLSELSRRHRVTLLTTHSPEEDPHALREKLPDCERIISFPYTPPKRNGIRFPWYLFCSWFSHMPVDLWKCRVAALRREATRLMVTKKVDLCVADFLVAVPNIPFGSPVPVVLFEHNVEYMIWKRLRDNTISAWQRPLLDIEWRKMRKCEIEACSRASVTIAVSATDRDMLTAMAPGACVHAVPTGVDAAYFFPKKQAETSDRLVYVGSMDWQPNEDAVLYFINAILPLIRSKRPSVSLTVVGRNPGNRLRQAAEKAGVHVTGTVEDVRAFVNDADVFIVPLRIGGGTRLKIFEALAMGKVVVSTTIGAEGLPLINNRHFVCADDPDTFAHAVVELLQDPVRRQTIGMAGRELVKAHYSWAHIAEQFEKLIIPHVNQAVGMRSENTVNLAERRAAHCVHTAVEGTDDRAVVSVKK